MAQNKSKKLPATILSAIGNTPLLELAPNILVKCEYLNPTGSIKARLANYLITKAEERGNLKPGTTIVEATSGNTGNAMAMVAAIKGYNFVMVMPEGFSSERLAISIGFGAKVRTTPGHDVTPARDLAIKLGKQKNWFCPAQFDTELNVECNYTGLGQEILNQIPVGTKIDAIVQGVGTGGTLIGVGQALRQNHNPNLKIFALEPAEATTLQTGEFSIHQIEGIGDGFVPQVFANHKKEIDGFINILSDDAIHTTKQLAKEYGAFVGPSSGANWLAAQKIQQQNPKIKTILTFFSDTGQKYLNCHFPIPRKTSLPSRHN